MTLHRHPVESPTPCFLCEPSQALQVVAECLSGSGLQIIAGLGPVTENYFVLGTVGHIRSFADADDPIAIGQNVARIRALIEDKIGPVVLTEHGRVPACTEGEAEHDPHCFHAHLLGFPGAPSFSTDVETHFRAKLTLPSIGDAFSAARQFDHYALVSEAADRNLVFGNPIQFPRQLLRVAAAKALGVPHLANWRDHPNEPEARQNAQRLTAVLD